MLDRVYALLFSKHKDTDDAAWTVYHSNKLAVGKEGETPQDKTSIYIMVLARRMVMPTRTGWDTKNTFWLSVGLGVLSCPQRRE